MTTYVRPVVEDKYCKGRDCVSATKVGIERICEIGAICFMDARRQRFKTFIEVGSRLSKRVRINTNKQYFNIYFDKNTVNVSLQLGEKAQLMSGNY